MHFSCFGKARAYSIFPFLVFEYCLIKSLFLGAVFLICGKAVLVKFNGIMEAFCKPGEASSPGDNASHSKGGCSVYIRNLHL